MNHDLFGIVELVRVNRRQVQRQIVLQTQRPTGTSSRRVKRTGATSSRRQLNSNSYAQPHTHISLVSRFGAASVVAVLHVSRACPSCHTTVVKHRGEIQAFARPPGPQSNRSRHHIP